MKMCYNGGGDKTDRRFSVEVYVQEKWKKTLIIV